MNRLLSTNFQHSYQFVTLKFNIGNHSSSIIRLRKEFENFLKRLRRYLMHIQGTKELQLIKYTAAIKCTAVGTPIIHLAANFPNLSEEELTMLWKNGEAFSQTIISSSEMNQIISHYLSMDFTRYSGYLYIHSQDLIKPNHFKKEINLFETNNLLRNHGIHCF